jgi:hypothetical protein
MIKKNNLLKKKVKIIKWKLYKIIAILIKMKFQMNNNLIKSKIFNNQISNKVIKILLNN